MKIGAEFGLATAAPGREDISGSPAFLPFRQE
jgi:hypothetical protein